jgi:hypothetical protein
LVAAAAGAGVGAAAGLVGSAGLGAVVGVAAGAEQAASRIGPAPRAAAMKRRRDVIASLL